MNQAHLCGRGRKGHRWDDIPVEWTPSLDGGYSDIVNERCERCGLIKAAMWDRTGNKTLRYRRWCTGVAVTLRDEEPWSADDYRRWQLNRFREEKPRRAKAKATAKPRASTAARKAA